MLLGRYLLKGWVRLFLLTLSTLVGILLVARIQEVARFGAICGSLLQTLRFLFYQIPYLIPFALPLSTLLASFILIDGLSTSHELTALRSTGLSFFRIFRPLMTPILLASLFNFFCSARLAPAFRAASQELLYQTAASHPLVLLQKGKLLKIKDLFVDVEMTEPPHKAAQLFLAWRDPGKEKIHYLIGEEPSSAKDYLSVERLTLVAPDQQGLWIETREEAMIDANLIYSLVHSSSSPLSPELLPISTLIKQKGTAFEIGKRCYFFFLPLTCACLGLSFGWSSARVGSRRRLIILTLSVILAFSGYLGGKDFTSSPLVGLSLFFLPQLFLWILSARRLVRWA